MLVLWSFRECIHFMRHPVVAAHYLFCRPPKHQPTTANSLEVLKLLGNKSVSSSGSDSGASRLSFLSAAHPGTSARCSHCKRFSTRQQPTTSCRLCAAVYPDWMWMLQRSCMLAPVSAGPAPNQLPVRWAAPWMRQLRPLFGKR